jgi:hypothetical protein
MANNNFDDTIWQGIKKPCQVSKTRDKKQIKKTSDNYRTVNKLLIIVNNFIKLLLLINLLVISSKFL